MRYLIVALIVFCWGYVDGLLSRLDDAISNEAKARATEEKAVTYAAVISGCFNGGTLTDGERTVRCRIVRD